MYENDDIVCPYCNNSTSREYYEEMIDSHRIEICDNCGKEYILLKEIICTEYYITEKITDDIKNTYHIIHDSMGYDIFSKTKEDLFEYIKKIAEDRGIKYIILVTDYKNNIVIKIDNIENYEEYREYFIK
jgi:DNA-directed RNA polymerase subunit RPC12/RpoP